MMVSSPALPPSPGRRCFSIACSERSTRSPYSVAMTKPNEAQFEFWEDLAPGWLASEKHTELVARGFGAAAMDRLALDAGERVLDIGCGSGATTLALAAIVGEKGAAVGVDISPAMVRAAQQAAASAGIEQATFVAADAQVGEIAGAPFDAAFSRFGVMFFADPAAAFANVRASLRAGGRLAFACWTNLFGNEWMFVPGSAVVAVTGTLPAMPAPGEPGPFSLEDPQRIEAVLADAGFTHIEVTPRDESIVIPRAEIESLVALSSRVGPVREALRTADSATAAAIEQAVRNALLERVADDALHVAAAALIVSAVA
jgi:SAM-dependent methyltransferase